MAQFEGFPPHFLIPIVGTIFGTIAAVVLLYPIVRAWARRMEHRDQPVLTEDVSARLARIEAAVESIAIEVERISENQRYLSKLQSEKLGAGSIPPTRR